MNRRTEVLLRRHHRAIARDPEFVRLSHPLSGQSVSAVSADGTTLYAEVFGTQDAPTIVLVPGWTEQVAFFDHVTRQLTAAGFRVVVYDLRGQGRSALAGSDYAIDRYGEDLEAVLAATCEGRSDVVVAGHSLGAMSIAAWARRHDVSARVCGAALMNTGLEGLISAARILPARLPRRLANWIANDAFLGNPLPFPPLSNPISIAAIRYVAFGPTATIGQIAFYEQMLAACPPRVRAAAGVSM
jgi:pimeloyl-ACP methyl ester carboxylesterase